MSIVGGRAFEHFFVNTADNFISIQNEMVIHNPYHDLVHYDDHFKYIAFFLTAHALGLAIFAAHYIRGNKTLWYLPNDRVLYNIFCFFNRKCYFDDFYNLFIVRPLLRLSYIFNYTIEEGIFKATTVGI
jgi:hypothetical protein